MRSSRGLVGISVDGEEFLLKSTLWTFGGFGAFGWATADLNSYCSENSPESATNLQIAGSSIHISDFVCESIGRLKLSNYEIGINNLLPDSMHLKYTKAGIAIYSGINRDALFMFDNSSNYGLFAEDALLVSQMDIKDGTKKLLLYDDTMSDGSKHIMIYIDNANVKRSKRIKQVLEERDFVSLLKIHCFACRSEQFMSAYELGLSGKAADFAVKKYHSHCRISKQVLEEFTYD
ncbi:7366_t:CDS:2 [Racocetra persica]|uniref:7366_t:CDS:1 n=1 Tax=Racocetra persica TaxID=160502 RepID=A0ACA9KHV7_9GLOM|nr:7366_t:CDS:2 [Racocetra persica]